MTVRTASARWEGNLLEGKGKVSLDSSELAQFDVSWPRRAEEPEGWTSPEELVGAAHAACFSMAFSGQLTNAGGAVDWIETNADVEFGKTDNGFAITEVRLSVRAKVDGLDDAAFDQAAQNAKSGCPISKALTGTTITLDAQRA